MKKESGRNVQIYGCILYLVDMIVDRVYLKLGWPQNLPTDSGSKASGLLLLISYLVLAVCGQTSLLPVSG